jgi:hypothetical protein
MDLEREAAGEIASPAGGETQTAALRRMPVAEAAVNEENLGARDDIEACLDDWRTHFRSLARLADVMSAAEEAFDVFMPIVAERHLSLQEVIDALSSASSARLGPAAPVIISRVFHGATPEEQAAAAPPSDPDVAHLAALPPIEYDRQRKDYAKRLGCSVTALDKAVRDHQAKARAAELPANLKAPEPWAEAIDGAALLGEITNAISRHVVMDDAGRHACAVFVLHAHAIDAADISPFLDISSPTRECGKSTALTVMFNLCPSSLYASNISPAGVYRTIAAWRPTLCIDEADTFLEQNDELRGVLNSGHSRATANVIRVEERDGKQVPAMFSTWCAKLIAQIRDLPDTIASRAIVVRLKRKPASHKVERLRLNRTEHLHILCRKAARWAQDNMNALMAADAEIPDELGNRAADNWSALFNIAAVCGGEWPARVKKAALAIEGHGGSESLEIRLLRDCRDVWREQEQQIASRTLIDRLSLDADAPWSNFRNGKEITTHAFAKLLEGFDIKSRKATSGSERDRKVWYRKDFEDAWQRYLPQPPSKQAPQSPQAPLNGSNKGAIERSMKKERSFKAPQSGAKITNYAAMHDAVVLPDDAFEPGAFEPDEHECSIGSRMEMF